ncbi:hypothetical protein Tco_1293920 [Tanacetum coccineum]
MSRVKGSHGKKTTDTHVADVDMSEESDLEPPKRKTTSRRVVKKKVTNSADDKIIYDDPNVALELGKPISKTKVEEAKAARQVHDTHARIVTKSVFEPTRRRKSGKVTSDPPKRLRGVSSLTLEEQEAADTMQALKERVPDESTVIFATSSEGTEEDQLDDEEKDYKDCDADDEGGDHISDTQDADGEDAETESDVDEIYKC